MTVEFTILVLLIIGFAFMTLEAIVPSFGLMGLGGAVSFFVALSMLRHQDRFYGLSVDLPLIAALGIIGLAVLAGSLYFVVTTWRKKISAGSETMPGASARVVEWAGGAGRVAHEGEIWAATGPQTLVPGDTVTITARQNLTLTVTKD